MHASHYVSGMHQVVKTRWLQDNLLFQWNNILETVVLKAQWNAHQCVTGSMIHPDVTKEDFWCDNMWSLMAFTKTSIDFVNNFANLLNLEINF